MSEELRRILFLQEPGHEDFVVRFQQTTGPVMAKGVEDTAFYRYFRLAALNEVGGSPARFGLSVVEFHEANARAAARFPLHLLTTYTHDTKRSPDVRSRIAAPDVVPRRVAREACADGTTSSGGLDDPREEVLVLPDARRRGCRSSASGSTRYLEKALREGKVNTNWLTPNVEHERASRSSRRARRSCSKRDPFLERVRDDRPQARPRAAASSS